MDASQVEILKENGFPYPLNVLDYLADDFDYETTIEKVVKGRVIKDVGTFCHHETGTTAMYQLFEDNYFIVIAAEEPEEWESSPNLYIVENIKFIEYIDVLHTFKDFNVEFVDAEIKRLKEEKLQLRSIPAFNSEIEILKEEIKDNPKLKGFLSRL
ncbi:hypothetical protein Goe2_c17900 [Bacillus phage vB_BsuM-Goe2]|uniref:Uncharacterized protein n=1 Tax=Bacillus phage vB_BsuM-Goe2 TaxID=1933062 RepID=A0A1Z1D9G8_9CAUD|nr:hypothetical protein Goe2_c17900 [Bacillus phage vB_BsuM-Goe2]